MTVLAARACRVLYNLVKTMITRRTVREIVAFLCLAIACLGLALGFDTLARVFGVPADAFRENGPIETAQSILVGLAALIFFIAALRFDYEIFYVAVTFAPLCGLAILREIPGCGSRFYEGGVCLTDTGKDWLTALVLGAALALVVIRREPMARRIADLNFFWILPAGIAAGFLVIGEAMEANYLVGPEETLETAAYLVLTAFAALINLRPAWFDARVERARGSGR